MGHGGGLDQQGGSEGGEKGLDSGDALKIKPGDSPKRSDIGEKK